VAVPLVRLIEWMVDRTWIVGKVSHQETAGGVTWYQAGKRFGHGSKIISLPGASTVTIEARISQDLMLVFICHACSLTRLSVLCLSFRD
jgi:hypothetical protein